MVAAKKAPQKIVNADPEMVAVKAIKPHPQNPRVGDVRAIVESIETNGWYGYIGVQRSSKLIVVGNHRYQAALDLGMTEVPVVWFDVDDATASRILLADNRTSDLSGYDDKALTSLLSDLAVNNTLSGTGWNGDDLEDLLAILARGQVPITPEVEKDMEEMQKMKDAQPRIVIETTVEMVQRFRELPGDTDHERLEAIMPAAVAAVTG